MGKHTLVAGGARIGGGNAIGAAKQSYTGEEDHEQDNDDGEGPLGILLRGVAKGVDPVGDGLDAGHGGASAGEDLGKKPKGEHRCADGQARRHNDRRRMASGGESAHRSDDDHEQQRADEEIGGDEEGRAGVFDAAHVDQGEQQQNGEAEGQRVGLEHRKRGNQRSDTRGDADCGVEDVVDHQRRGGEQAGMLTQVLRGDRVAATTVRIGINGLEVGDVDDRKQEDDGEADGYDVLNARETKGDEKR